jgi:hypothetical protein
LAALPRGRSQRGAQQPAGPVVGFMHAAARSDDDFVGAFKEGLRQSGYVDVGM